MKAIEKAQDLVSKFFNNDLKNITGFKLAKIEAKNCALIAVNEVINTIEFMVESDDPDKLPFWQEVKEEIIKF